MRDTSQAVKRRPGQILEGHDLAEDSTTQANLETACMDSPNNGTLRLLNDDDEDGLKNGMLYRQTSSNSLESLKHRLYRPNRQATMRTGVLCPTGIVCQFVNRNRKARNTNDKTVVRPALLYGAETWATTRGQEARLEVNEMRMLRWMHVRSHKEG